MPSHDEFCDRAAGIAMTRGDLTVQRLSSDPEIPPANARLIGEKTAYACLADELLKLVDPEEADEVLTRFERRLRADMRKEKVA